jgi:hypothetical protein
MIMTFSIMAFFIVAFFGAPLADFPDVKFLGWRDALAFCTLARATSGEARRNRELGPK